jgi:hypothetical protein
MRENYTPLAASLVAAAALLGAALPARTQSDGSSMMASTTVDASVEASSSAPIDLSAPAAPDWDRVDGTEAVSNGSQVLELPQVDPTRTKGGGNDTDAAQQGSEEGADAADEVGSVDDYENQSAMTSVGVYMVPIPAGVRRNGIGLATVPAAPGIRLAPGIGAMAPMGPITVRPGGLGPFPATSPMLTPPRGSRSIPGGWWTRAR